MKQKVEKLLKKFSIKANSYYNYNPYLSTEVSIYKEEIKLCENWQHRVATGWYGISIGSPAPVSWFQFLNEFLRIVEQYNPDFKILQVALKYGRCKIYLDNISEETHDIIESVSNELFDKNLIY